MKIKGVDAKSIFDSRKEKTILVSIETNVGKFSASSPNGKSKGKFEAKPYKKNLEGDIKTLKKLKEYFTEDSIDKFEDLRRIEDIVDGHVGANTLFALESAVLKAIAKEQKKQVWEVINPKAKKFPRLVGNCVGGGKHSSSEKKPDFQEFLLIPNTKTVEEAFEKNKQIRERVQDELRKADTEFKGDVSDENGWMTSLNEKQILDILKDFKVNLGVDIAASSFYKRKKYGYENPLLKRDSEEQLLYLSNLINNYNLLYIEDPFDEKDFENTAKLVEKFPNKLIVGDDLIVTNLKRLKKAIEMKAVTAIIVKPNQNGSLIDVCRVCNLAKKNNVKIVVSHRSGETEEDILGDIAFGVGADFLKGGILGKEREAKIKRLIEIEKSLR